MIKNKQYVHGHSEEEAALHFRTESIYQKRWFLLALVLALAAVWGIFSYIGMTQTAVPVIQLNPGTEPEQWTFTLKDGTVLTPDQSGGFALPSADTVLYCTHSLAEYRDRLTSNPLIYVSVWNCDAAVLADGRLVADPTHRFLWPEGRFEPAMEPSAGGGLFSIGSAKELTIAVRFLSEPFSLSALPTLSLYTELHAYSSQWTASTASSALPAGIFLAAALFLAGLFLFQLYYKKANWGGLLLALLALSFCLQNTVSYSVYVIWMLRIPVVLWGIQVFPALIILWLLWYHTQGKLRRLGWLLPVLGSVGFAGGILWRLVDNASGARWTNLLQSKLLPLAVLLALLCCGWHAYRGNSYFRRFFLWGGVLVVCAGCGLFLSFLQNGSWWNSFYIALRTSRMMGNLFHLMEQASYLLLLLFFLMAFYDFVQNIVHRNQELQALTLQNRYTAEHAAFLSRSLDDTRALRHELRHHMEALRALCREGDLQRVSSYAELLGSQWDEVSGHYTDNALLNALVCSYADRAKRLGAEFEAVVQAPEQLAIEDADLAVLLSNMADNALEALSAAVDGQDRWLHLKVEIFENTGLFISCSNSFHGQLKRDHNGALLSTKTGQGHGLGLKAMRRVAEKYNSVLVVETQRQVFHVKTYLYFQ